jgi:hypothetical protein
MYWGARRVSVGERFAAYYEAIPIAGCWVWTGTGSKRYGCLFFRRSIWLAHRVSWVLHRGEIPEGASVMHVCDNGFCVNPDHLRLGTHAENMADMKQKGRARAQSGSDHWMARTPERILRGAANPCFGKSRRTERTIATPERIALVREAYASNPKRSMAELGRQFGMGHETARKIARGLI